MYFNVFDHARGMGGWFRIGNRPNERHAEVTCCVYLPDGRVAFMFQRPEHTKNDELAAGGMRIEVVEPLKRLRLTYDGVACLLAEPAQMADPKRAFTTNPMVGCRVDLDFEGISPAFGGERVDEHGRPLEEDPTEAFARGHYEQHLRGTGVIEVDGQAYPVDGLGLRDHSWGPRYWQNISWYRWFPLVFTEDFALCLAVISLHQREPEIGGMVLRVDEAGAKDYVPITSAQIESVYDENDRARAQHLRIRTGEREYVVTGEALSTIPLRSRRRTDAGELLETRITEAMTRFSCDGLTGFGMSEYLDQIVDGVPVGRHC